MEVMLLPNGIQDGAGKGTRPSRSATTAAIARASLGTPIARAVAVTVLVSQIAWGSMATSSTLRDRVIDVFDEAGRTGTRSTGCEVLVREQLREMVRVAGGGRG